VFLLLQFCTYGQLLVVRAKTVSLSVRHIAYFTFTFLHTVQINDDENDESMQ